jgi:DNA-binding CsgD family transcriptional regulator
MTEKIDLQGSTAMTLANKVARICKPLQVLGITHFQYMRKFVGGNRFILCDYPRLMQYFYEECFYPLTWYDHNKPLVQQSSHFEFWPISALYNSKEQNDLDHNVQTLFGISQSVTYLEKTLHFLEVFRFFSNDKIIYQIDSDRLFRFIYYFRESMQRFIVQAKKESIFVPIVEDPALDKKTVENEVNFAELMPINRYYLPESKNYITLRERDCLYWCAQGKSSEEISIILGISKRTVENNLQKIKEKLNCCKQTQLARIASKMSLID